MKLRQFTVNALQKKKEKPAEQSLVFKKDSSGQKSKTGRSYQKEVTISLPSFYKEIKSDRVSPKVYSI